MPIDIKNYLRGQIDLGLRRFVADLAAIDEPNRSASPGGCARSPYDLTYELSVVNQDYAIRLRGESSTAPTGFNFEHAPADFQNVDFAISTGNKIDGGYCAFLAALDAIPESEMETPLAGTKATPLGLATTVNRHLHYHDAQLNYIQTLLGDGEVHWP